MKQMLFVIGVASASGCVADGLSSEEQAIHNGDYTSRADAERYGAVVIGEHRGTGVMLSNSLALSAAHVEGRIASTVHFAWTPESEHIRAETYTFSAVDLAVYKLDRPLKMNGSEEGFENIIGAADVGDTVLTFGQGDLNAEGANDGSMHQGVMRVIEIGGAQYPKYTTLLPDPGQIMAGDSGGPTFDRNQLIGIHGQSASLDNCLTCTAEDITLFPLFWGIVAVSLPWTSENTNLLNIMGAEIRVNDEIDYNEDTGPWEQLARIANEMCVNRSDQVAGHYTGHFGDDRFGLVCSGRDSKHVTVVQSRRSDRVALGAATARFETMDWGFANELAREDCMQRGQFAAGYYTGDHDASDNWTLVCHVGKAFDATRIELVAGGFPGKDIADTTYAEGMRAADKFCAGRADNLPPRVYKTGFMTGRTAANNKTYEILCEY